MKDDLKKLQFGSFILIYYLQSYLQEPGLEFPRKKHRKCVCGSVQPRLLRLIFHQRMYLNIVTF
jgi:hypothetical protein